MNRAILTSILFALVCYLVVYSRTTIGEHHAVATLNSDTVTGLVRFQQIGDVLQIKILANLLNTDGVKTKHGLHVHTFGDVSTGCTSTGAHYDGGGKSHTHGSLTSLTAERHDGDLGNVEGNEQGVIEHNIILSVNRQRLSINPCSVHSIIGRAIVIHAHMDDLGLSNDVESNISGNSGKRIACAVIGLAPGLASGLDRVDDM